MRLLDSVWRFGKALGGSILLLLLIAVAAPSTRSAETQIISPAATPDEEPLTLLRFETQHYLVRVYRETGQTYLNVYNKETGFTDQNRVLAYLLDPDREESDWRVYVNQEGDLEYRAKVNPEGDTALEIRIMGGPPAQPEFGFNATYSFPHVYLGEDLENALVALQESGWSINATETTAIELIRNQLKLALKFDPQTQRITYTQLAEI